MCAKIVGLVRKGRMREGWSEDRLFDEIQSYHSTRSEFRLTEIAFEEGMRDLLAWLEGQEAVDAVDSARDALVARGLAR